MGLDTPCQCPRCGWLGTLHDTHELQSDPPQNICPQCTTETAVQNLGKKGLDGLRSEFKKRAWNTKERADRLSQLQHFFQRISAEKS